MPGRLTETEAPRGRTRASRQRSHAPGDEGECCTDGKPDLWPCGASLEGGAHPPAQTRALIPGQHGREAPQPPPRRSQSTIWRVEPHLRMNAALNSGTLQFANEAGLRGRQRRGQQSSGRQAPPCLLDGGQVAQTVAPAASLGFSPRGPPLPRTVLAPPMPSIEGGRCRSQIWSSSAHTHSATEVLEAQAPSGSSIPGHVYKGRDIANPLPGQMGDQVFSVPG